jgi:hypothetical protein
MVFETLLQMRPRIRMVMSPFHVQMREGVSVRRANVLAGHHSQAVARAQRKIDTRAHNAGQTIRAVIVDTNVTDAPVMRICDSDRRTEHIIIRRRRQAERIEAFAVRGQLASAVKGSQHFPSDSAAPGLVHIKMNRRPAAGDRRNGKRSEKQRRQNRSLRHGPSSPLRSILGEASPPSKSE